MAAAPIRVLVLHDWFCDHSSWEAALPYLTPERFTYCGAAVTSRNTRVGSA
jgi:hypothetical protein